MKILLRLNFDIQLFVTLFFMVFVAVCMFEVFYITLLWKMRENTIFSGV